MKKHIVFILITVLGCTLNIAVQADSAQGEKTILTPITQITTPTKKEITVYYRVDGMTCQACAYGIEKKFKGIKYVNAVDVDFKKGIVTITSSQPLDFTEKQLTKLFNDVGMSYRCQVKNTNGTCSPHK